MGVPPPAALGTATRPQRRNARARPPDPGPLLRGEGEGVQLVPAVIVVAAAPDDQAVSLRVVGAAAPADHFRPPFWRPLLGACSDSPRSLPSVTRLSVRWF